MEYRRKTQPRTRRRIDDAFDYPSDGRDIPSRSERGRGGKRTTMTPRDSSIGTSNNNGFALPSSISIQKSASSEKRSPAASPSERDGESRQRNSPHRPKQQRRPNNNTTNNSNTAATNANNNNTAATSEMEQHRIAGRTFFLRNRLSEAADSYSRAIRTGLEELKHRRAVLSRLDGRGGVDRMDGNDAVLMQLGESVALLHLDMGHALEICGKYSDAKEEYDNGVGLLQNTCNKRDDTNRILRSAVENVRRMTSAVEMEGRRSEYAKELEAAMRKIDHSSTSSGKESARVHAMGCIQRWIRLERDAIGDECYAVAKLTLKFAKLKCECGELDDGLDHAESAIKTLQNVLGSKHALVGAGCSFAASAYEKRVSALISSPTTCSNRIEGLTADIKVMIDRALELYADALESMQFKYDDHDDTSARPEIGEVFHKIARLYAKKGDDVSALDAYRRSLESYGAEHRGFRSEAAVVWHDVAVLHLATGDYRDAIDASSKSTELANKVGSASRSRKSSDRIETLAVWNLQIAGDAHGALNQYEKATGSYQDAMAELKRVQPNSRSSRGCALGPLDESRLLKRIGMALLKRDKIDEAKDSLIDALRVMRQERGSEKIQDLPLLMTELGALHLRTNDYTAALAVLRPCLKLYADQGISEYSSQVQKARDLFKMAQDRSSGRLDSSDVDSYRLIRPDPIQARLSTRSNKTQVTLVTSPSTNPSSSQSTPLSPRQLEVAFTPDHSPALHDDHGNSNEQLEQAKIEMAQLKEAHSMEISRLNSAHQAETSALKETHATHLREKEVSLEQSKEEIARLKDSHQQEAIKLRQAQAASSHNEEIHSLSSQLDKKIAELARVKEIQSRDAILLEEMEDKLKLSKQKLKEVQAERDQEKKERVQGGNSLRSEMDKTAVKAKEMEAEVERLKKELSVSESSYQQILSAIDEEKEVLGKSHESKVAELMNENSRLRKEVHGANELREQELIPLREQNKTITQQNGLLKYDIRVLRGEKEALAAEMAKLQNKLDQKANERTNEAALAEKLRKAELELESEKRRRAILEASLDNEFDNRQVQMPYPMFGYPPMNMPMSYGGGDRSDKKAKLLEVDLAAERENKEVLEKTVSELTAALEQEKNAQQAQRESLATTHEHEMNEVFSELKKKDADIAELSEVATQFHSVVEELGDTKKLLEKKSELADAYEREHALLVETREQLSNEKTTSESIKMDLTKIQQNLQLKIQEYEELLDQHERMKKLHDDVASYYESTNSEITRDLEVKVAEIQEMKSNHEREVARVEEKLIGATATHRQEIARLENTLAEESDRLSDEIDQKSLELSETKDALKDALADLEEVYSSREDAHQQITKLKQLVDEQKHDLIQALASKETLESDTKYLRAMSENFDEDLDQANERIKSLTLENSSLEIEMDRIRGELADTQQENAVYEEQFADFERVLDEMDSKLVKAENDVKIAEDSLATAQRNMDAREKDAEMIYDKYTELETSFERILTSVIKRFDKLVPGADSIMESSEDSLEAKKIQITTLATIVSSQMKEKDQHIDEVNFEMTNALRELDTLEAKYKQVRGDLAISAKACKNDQEMERDYDELIRYCADLENTVTENRDIGEQIHKLQSERKTLLDQVTKLKEGLTSAEEQRDVFQSRLKEAVDDLEELENERNGIRSDLDKRYTESTKMETSLRVKIECLEEENERLAKIEASSLEKDAIVWDKENQLKELEKELEIANNALDILRPKSIPVNDGIKTKRRSHSLSANEIYPDLLPSDTDVCDELASLRSVIKALESQNMKLSEKLSDLQGGAPKMQDSQIQTTESAIDTLSPPPTLHSRDVDVQTIESSSETEDILSLKTRLSELISQNDELTKQINHLRLEAEAKKTEHDDDVAQKEELLEEIGSLTTKIQSLQETNQDLTTKINKSQTELAKAAENEGEKLCVLKDEVDDLKEQNRNLKHDLNELTSRTNYASGAAKDDLASEKEEMLQEITLLRDHVQTLEEYNTELSSQLEELQDAVESIRSNERDAIAEEIGCLQSQIEALETRNGEMSAKLEVCSLGSSDKYQEVNSDHQKEITSLRKALAEKDANMHADCKKAFEQHKAELAALQSKLDNLESEQTNSDIHAGCKKEFEDQKRQHLGDLEALNSQLEQLHNCNDANHEEISSLQIDLQNALKDCDENEIRHQQELSTVNMEFTNALNSLENLQKENKRLQLDIQSLSAMSQASLHGGQELLDKNAYFEREITAAHSRFVSMEQSLQNRIERLEGEKYKLIMAHKDEIEKKDTAFEKVRVELSAWKLEMQNALNDIEGLKKEKMELEKQVLSFKESFDVLQAENKEKMLVDFVNKHDFVNN